MDKFIRTVSITPASLNSSKAPERGLCHRWYRSVLAFPDHLVADLLPANKPGSTVVLDPFVGTGTTAVEAKLRGFQALAVDAVPFFSFVTRTKADWSVRPDVLFHKFSETKEALIDETVRVAKFLTDNPNSPRRERFPGWNLRNLTTLPSIVPVHYVDPANLCQAIMFRDAFMDISQKAVRDKLLLALADAFVKVSNVSFRPEISLTPSKGMLPVVEILEKSVIAMRLDLQILNNIKSPGAVVYTGDSRDLADILEPKSVDLVVSSPPYPVDKDYTRQARLELALLGYAKDMKDIRRIKRGMIRSSTRQIFADDEDYTYVRNFETVQRLVRRISTRSRNDGDTSGFSKMYPRLVGNYFGGMYRHFESLFPVLRRGAKCAYVIGDSRSFKQVHIETAKILALLAKRVGFSIQGLQLWRIRRSTKLTQPLPEHILYLSKR